MGYTTNFTGAFRVDPPLTPDRVRYLQRFNETRRMKRSAAALEAIPDPLRVAVGLPVGPDGAFFVGSDDPNGQDMEHPSVVECNDSPSGQPALWCQWRPSERGTVIAWDGGEKFYFYVEWLEYLIAEFLRPWGHAISGEVHWVGEDPSDTGIIRVRDNAVEEISHAYVEFLGREDRESGFTEIEFGAEGIRLGATRPAASSGDRAPAPGRRALLVEALTRHLNDETSSIRRSAADALATFGAGAATAVPDLIEALRDPDYTVRAAAALALGEIGAAASAAIPALEELENDPAYSPSGCAREALAKIRR